MKDTNKIDPLPDSFESEEQAGEFWDTHSTMDYEKHVEPTEDTINIGRSHQAAGSNPLISRTTRFTSS